jgi:hypothetical protein
MYHMRLHPMRTKPARQPEAVTAGFESQCNPRDLAAGPDRLVAPAMKQAKQPFCTRLQLLARLALNAGKHTGDQPPRAAVAWIGRLLRQGLRLDDNADNDTRISKHLRRARRDGPLL